MAHRQQSIAIDPAVRRHDRGRTLVGGSPLRILRLSDRGARLLDQLDAGAAVPDDAATQRLVRTLIDGGLAHPRAPLGVAAADTSASAPSALEHVSLVIPVRDDAVGLNSLLTSVQAAGPGLAHVVVVDDASIVAAAPRPTTVSAINGIMIAHDRPRGPAAARNSGWRATDTELVAFVDADVELPHGFWIPLLAHFDDPDVGIVAPRVAAPSGTNALDRYEVHRSALDLGPEESGVAPRTRVPYVPSAALVVRRTVLEALDGFDEAMRVGEDVDFVWRAVSAGWRVRYVPAVLTHHRNRRSWRALGRQRRTYGTAAAPLASRHPGVVTPLEINAWSLVSWMLVALGRRRGAALGAGIAGATAWGLVPKLRGRVDRPAMEAARLGGLGHLHAGRWIAAAVTRTWLPLGVVAAIVSRRARRALIACIVVPGLLEWLSDAPDLDPARWTAARLFDDASYCAGVWQGAAAEGSIAALTPTFTQIEGLTRSKAATPPSADLA